MDEQIGFKGTGFTESVNPKVKDLSCQVTPAVSGSPYKRCRLDCTESATARSHYVTKKDTNEYVEEGLEAADTENQILRDSPLALDR